MGSTNSKTYLLRCIARSATPPSASLKIAFALLRFFIQRGIRASREHSAVAVGENVSVLCPAAGAAGLGGPLSWCWEPPAHAPVSRTFPRKAREALTHGSSFAR